LVEKPTVQGLRTDFRTARRAADLIRRRFGVDYHTDYLRAWLRRRGCSPRKPHTPDQAEEPFGHRPLGGRGLAEDPGKAAATNTHLVLIDETGLFLTPLVRRP